MPEENATDEAGNDQGGLLPTHSEDGVDLTLIRWMLSLSPAERLQALQGYVDSVLELREMRFQGDAPSA